MCTLCTLCMYVWRSWNLWLYLHIYHLFGTCRCISAYRDSGDSGSDRNFYPGRTEVQRKWENGAGISWKLDGVSNVFYFHPYLGNDPFWLYNIFQMGWNHQLENFKRHWCHQWELPIQTSHPDDSLQEEQCFKVPGTSEGVTGATWFPVSRSTGVKFNPALYVSGLTMEPGPVQHILA